METEIGKIFYNLKFSSFSIPSASLWDEGKSRWLYTRFRRLKVLLFMLTQLMTALLQCNWYVHAGFVYNVRTRIFLLIWISNGNIRRMK